MAKRKSIRKKKSNKINIGGQWMTKYEYNELIGKSKKKDRSKSISEDKAINTPVEKLSNKQVKQAEKKLASLLNNELKMRKQIYNVAPQYLEKQIPMGREDFGPIVDKRSGFTVRDNVESMQKTIQEHSIITEKGKQEYFNALKTKIMGLEPRKTGGGRAFDYSGRIADDDYKAELNKLSLEDIYNVYDILNELKYMSDKRNEYYDVGDFDSLIVAAARNPEVLNAGSPLDKIKAARKEMISFKQEREQRAKALLAQTGVTIFDI